ncbi:MAG: hypothetical protein BJ554DRAFT_7762, partial [Olpidium bornovanus]
KNPPPTATVHSPSPSLYLSGRPNRPRRFPAGTQRSENMDVDDMDYELPQDEELTAFAASAPANFAAGRPPGPGVPDSSLYKRCAAQLFPV